MKKGQTTLTTVGRVIIRIYLAIFSLAIMLPVLWSITTSLKSTKEFLVNPFGFPQEIHLENYANAWKTANIGGYFFNTFYISVIVIVLAALIGAMISYACTRLKLRSGKYFSFLFMLGLFVPTELCAVTIFLQVRSFGLLDTHLGLILLYVAIRLPFTIFVLQGYFRRIPHELEEAAIIDGCSLNQTFWKIMFPLSKPGLATVSIFNFIGVWNEYIMAKSLIMTPNKVTLSIGLVSLQAATSHACDWGAMFAGMNIVLLPTLVIYLIFQKSITLGVTAGAVKG